MGERADKPDRWIELLRDNPEAREKLLYAGRKLMSNGSLAKSVAKAVGVEFDHLSGFLSLFYPLVIRSPIFP